MNKLAARLIKSEVIQDIRSEEKSFAKLDISLQNQKDHIDLGITSQVIRHVRGRIYGVSSHVKGDVPQHIWDETFVKDTSQSDHYHMDMVWGYLRKRFPLLTEITLAILVVPHSNAADERVLSMIRKSKTEFRSRLDLSKSLNSVMRIKMSLPEQIQPCYHWKPNKELLKKCKICM